MTDLPPDWAIQRAIDLRHDLDPAVEWRLDTIKDAPKGYASMIAFARYIAQHEQPPVDPLLIEAREIVAEAWRRSPFNGPANAARALSGEADDTVPVKAVLAALRKHSQ